MNEEIYWLTCSCCGALIRNTPEDNTSFSDSPYPHDESFGMCRGCGGNPEAKDIKKKPGWAMVTFCEARFKVVRNSVSPENQQKWDNFSYEKKCYTVLGLVEKGAIV